MKQQGCGDVVGKIADDFQRAAVLFSLAKIELQGIGLVDQQFAMAGGFFPEQLNQVSIQFHGFEGAMFFKQGQRDGAVTRADFDNGVARPRAYRADDALDYRRVVEKMLTESFAGAVGHGSVSRVCEPLPNQLDRQYYRRLQAPAVGLTRSGQIQCGAMVHRGTDQWQTEADVDGPSEAGMF